MGWTTAESGVYVFAKGQEILSRRQSHQTSTGAHSIPAGGSVDCVTTAGKRRYPSTTPVLMLRRRGATFALLHLTMAGGKVKVKVKFTVEPATNAQRGSRSIAVLFL